MNSGNKRKKFQFIRNRKLMHQLGIFFFVFLGLASLANMVMVYQKGMEMLLQEKAGGYLHMADYMADSMEDHAVLPWLLSYWETHDRELDITYDNPEAARQKWEEFDKENPELDIHLLTAAEVEALPAGQQKLFAEAEYMDWLNKLNHMKKVYHPDFLSCYYPRNDTEMYYFLSAAEEGQERGMQAGTAFILGTVKESDLETHQVRTATWNTGKLQNGLDTSGSGHYHAYAPVLSEGKPICLIDVTIDMSTVQKELLKDILGMEIFSIGAFIVSAVLLMLVIRRTIIYPVTELQSAMHDYQENKLPEEVERKLKQYFGLNEIGRLSEDFSLLAKEMQDYTKRIETMAVERERIAGELNLATRIQFSMLPKEIPEDTRFELAAYMLPAKEVGGDLYDFFYVDDTHLALVIGDVSGKGIPAAIFMAVAKMLLKNTVLSGSTPGRILEKVNDQLCESNEAEMFVTVWLGILNLTTGHMVCGNAGHEYPAICRRNGSFELFRDKHGLVLGGMPGIPYKDYEMILEPGDKLFVYTDGVAEAADPDGGLYGTERMIKALEQGKELDAKALLAHVKAKVDQFAGDAPQFDDITMCYLKYKGEREES